MQRLGLELLRECEDEGVIIKANSRINFFYFFISLSFFVIIFSLSPQSVREFANIRQGLPGHHQQHVAGTKEEGEEIAGQRHL
jgi:hypothetical protein